MSRTSLCELEPMQLKTQTAKCKLEKCQAKMEQKGETLLEPYINGNEDRRGENASRLMEVCKEELISDRKNEDGEFLKHHRML